MQTFSFQIYYPSNCFNLRWYNFLIFIHIARKTFAKTVLLENDVLIEIVSELFGHSVIGMTKDHYAVIMKNKLKEHIVKVSKKLK